MPLVSKAACGFVLSVIIFRGMVAGEASAVVAPNIPSDAAAHARSAEAQALLEASRAEEMREDSRVMDYLETDPDVDVSKVGVMGHSRGGKAALVALADDSRFAIGFISSSGAGGANPYRRNYGQQVENLTAPNEFHWFAGNFLKYGAVGKTANDMPVDSHEFIALVGPRPLFIGGGSYIDTPPCAIPGDAWQDTRGMFMAAVAASPAWEIYGKTGLQTHAFPPIETFLSKGNIAFRQHPYGHTPMPNWSYFIAFAAKQFAKD